MWRALLLLCLVTPSRASQVHLDKVSLEEVVGWSTHIAVVEAADPPARLLSVPVTEPGGPWPAFETSVARWTVLELLRAPAGAPGVGQVLEVGGATDPDLYFLHVKDTVYRIRKSPIFPVYEPSFGAAPAPAQRILFLRPCNIGAERLLCGSALDAVEAVSMKARVLELSRSHPGPEPEQVLPEAPTPTPP